MTRFVKWAILAIVASAGIIGVSLNNSEPVRALTVHKQPISKVEAKKETKKPVKKKPIVKKPIKKKPIKRKKKSPSRGGSTFTFESTAYTWTGNRTATGVWPKEGVTIAVDPRVIPLGTKVQINGNIYIAQDTGGAIKGRMIDMYFSTKAECIKWGRRDIRVTILD